MHQSTAVRICFRLKWKKCGVWVEIQCNKVDRRDSIACINLQLSGYASDLNGKNVVCVGGDYSVISFSRSKRCLLHASIYSCQDMLQT